MSHADTAAPYLTLVTRFRGFEALHRSISAFFLVLEVVRGDY